MRPGGFDLSVDVDAEAWRATPLCRETLSPCRFEEVFHNFCPVQLVSTDPLRSPLHALRLSCPSFVHLGRSRVKMELSGTRVVLEVKGKKGLEGLMQHRSSTEDYH